ncbi:MAG: M23 family metallopeptidase [Clostridia bacterium]|nr:M23 family metallopeptidase [Clostridia bacterium]
MKKLRRGFDAWGHYLLALLCAGVILLSAAWTREQRSGEIAGHQALSDQSQRLSQITPPPIKEVYCRPTDGDVLRPFSKEPVCFPDLRLWSVHPAVDFSANEGEKVYAICAGTVISCGNGCVRLRHENGLESLYRGLMKINVSPGQAVKKGAVLGLAGLRVPYEGEGHICIALFENGIPVPFEVE